MRRRSSGAVAVGVAALVASWAFGSTPLAVVGVGFVLAGLLARVWAGAARDTVELERRLLPGDRVEGSEVVDRGPGSAPPPSARRLDHAAAAARCGRARGTDARLAHRAHVLRPSTRQARARADRGRPRRSTRPRAGGAAARRALTRPHQAAHPGAHLRVLDPRGPRDRRGALRSSAGRRDSRSTPSATTRRGSRCGPCTGRAPPGAAG